MLMTHGLWFTLSLLRQRLRACCVALQALAADQEEQERRKRRRDAVLDCLPDACPDACDSSGCMPDACSLQVRFRRP